MMRERFTKLALGLALFLCNAGPGRGEDWPGFRGPTGMGATAENGLPLEWGGADSKNVLWKSPLPPTLLDGDPDHNQSSPVVFAGKVFITTAHWPKGVEKTKQAPEHHIACYDAESGKQLWDTEVAAGPWVLTDSSDHNHVLHSLSKSFTSTAIGFAVAEGKIDIFDPVLRFFPDDAPADPSGNLKAMRVCELLTMSTGHQDEPPTSPDKMSVSSFLAHPVPHKPETHFRYNTAATPAGVLAAPGKKP